VSATFDPRAHSAAAAELAGRVIAITGASDGIGRAVALACARHQASVVLIGRNVRKLEAVHAEIAAGGAPEASIAELDLERALAADYDRVADAVLERSMGCCTTQRFSAPSRPSSTTTCRPGAGCCTSMSPPPLR